VGTPRWGLLSYHCLVMRKVLAAVSVVVACLVLLGCGPGAPFVPDAGAFVGSFSDSAAADVGDLSFTAHQAGIAGTGLITSGALEIDVAIAGNVSDGVITGQVTNTFLGSGTFRGEFNNEQAASGTFTFEIVTGTELAGTWSASID
jgi:hypothetical protein